MHHTERYGSADHYVSVTTGADAGVYVSGIVFGCRFVGRIV